MQPTPMSEPSTPNPIDLEFPEEQLEALFGEGEGLSFFRASFGYIKAHIAEYTAHDPKFEIKSRIMFLFLAELGAINYRLGMAGETDPYATIDETIKSVLEKFGDLAAPYGDQFRDMCFDQAFRCEDLLADIYDFIEDKELGKSFRQDPDEE